jgi:hypothetical protein
MAARQSDAIPRSFAHVAGHQSISASCAMSLMWSLQSNTNAGLNSFRFCLASIYKIIIISTHSFLKNACKMYYVSYDKDCYCYDHNKI